jgi:hypothetical protein
MKPIISMYKLNGELRDEEILGSYFWPLADLLHENFLKISSIFKITHILFFSCELICFIRKLRIVGVSNKATSSDYKGRLEWAIKEFLVSEVTLFAEM